MNPLGAAPAVVVFDFDPVGVILGFAVRWQIAAVALVIFAALLLAGGIASVVERRRSARLAPEATDADEQPTPADADPGRGPIELRADDLLFIVAGGIAGAVLVGRAGWVLLYLDWYRAHPGSIIDPAVGGLTLAGGVVGGVVAGMAMAAVLGAPVARWLGVAIAPLLLALGLGKLAMVLGGAGQGLPTEVPWATAYAGPGPWGSLAPLLPSHPAQVYEALTTAGALLVVLFIARGSASRRHPAALFAAGIELWAAGRFVVAFAWRDPALAWGLNGDQLVTAGIAVVAALSVIAISVPAFARGRRRTAMPTGSAVEPEVEPEAEPDAEPAAEPAAEPEAEPAVPPPAAAPEEAAPDGLATETDPGAPRWPHPLS